MSSDEPTLITPSPAHIALALITVRSKPAHITIEDYLTMLLTSVTQQQSLPAEGGHASLDTAKFWKQAYERVERENAKLQDYIHRFESERLEASNEQFAFSKKRKADTELPVKANTQSKRRELDRDLSLAEIVDFGQRSSSNSSENIKGLLRHVFQLKCLLRSANPPPDQLCLRTGSFCQAVETVLGSMSSQKKGTSADNASFVRVEDLSPLFTASYPLILQALDHATTSEAPDNDLTIANGSIVQLFQAVLGQLHRLALDEVTRLEEEERLRGKKPKSNTKAVKTDLQDVKNNLESSSRAILRMLVSMLTSVDPAKDAHCELLEGLLCALLDHIGSSLSLCIFADLDAPKGEVGVEPPCGLAHVSHIKTKAALAAAEIEGPYLIAVLRSGLRFLRDNHQSMSAFMKEIFSWTEQKDIGDADVLREKIEARLQGTLLRGVFGDDDKTFGNALRREYPLEMADMQVIKEGLRDDEQDKSTWFIGQMWEQLGWEMLPGRPKGTEGRTT